MVTQRVPSSGTEETCRGLVECATTDFYAMVAAVFLLFFLATVVDLRRALSVVESEHSRLVAEADAFAAFADRLADVDTRQPVFDGGRRAGDAAAEQVAPQLERVREAYRDTVMSVPHYEEEYGEPLPASMAVEFGDDVAGAVASGTTLTPRLKQTMLERSRRAVRKRRLLADHLSEEEAAVEAASERLDQVEESVDRIEAEPLESYDYGDLMGEWFLLRDREGECRDVLEERQATVQDRRGLADRVDVVDTLEGYIYEPLTVDYPVIAAGTQLLERVQDAQHEVVAGLATRE